MSTGPLEVVADLGGSVNGSGMAVASIGGTAGSEKCFTQAIERIGLSRSCG